VKCGILEAEKGVKGGVRLRQAAAGITLLSIVEDCQGTIAGGFCKSTRPPSAYCSFHRAALELHEAITAVLERWTLADLLEIPQAAEERAAG
jgi:DNA-binding IscR family transcriptional regulator